MPILEKANKYILCSYSLFFSSKLLCTQSAVNRLNKFYNLLGITFSLDIYTKLIIFKLHVVIINEIILNL